MTNSSSHQNYTVANSLDILEEQVEFDVWQVEVSMDRAARENLASHMPSGSLLASVKSRLFERLDRVAAQPADLLELLAWPITDLQQVALDLNTWQPVAVPSGSERVIWHVDKANAQFAFFLRVPMGGIIPKHWHVRGESILVLAGSFIDDDGTVYEVGNLFTAAAHTSHQPTASPGCLILGITYSDPLGIWRPGHDVKTA